MLQRQYCPRSGWYKLVPPSHAQNVGIQASAYPKRLTRRLGDERGKTYRQLASLRRLAHALRPIANARGWPRPGFEEDRHSEDRRRRADTPQGTKARS